MDIIKGKVNNTIVDVIDSKEYFRNPNLYDTNTAIQSDGLLYPIRHGSTRTEPGFYTNDNGMYGVYVDPSEAERANYEAQNQIIDFSNAANLKDVIDKTIELQAMERQILTTPDNIFIPQIGENDTPIMQGLKQCVISKEIDVDKYKNRIPQYNNDKRLFSNNDITLGKAIIWWKALDIRAVLTLENVSPDVPNPMPAPITVELTGSQE